MSAEKSKEVEEKEKQDIEDTKEETTAKVEDGKIKVALKYPIKFNGIDIKEVELDFKALTGGDICEAESIFSSKYYTPYADSRYHSGYHAAIAAKASKLPYDAILELKPKDFEQVLSATRGFLIAWE